MTLLDSGRSVFYILAPTLRMNDAELICLAATNIIQLIILLVKS